MNDVSHMAVIRQARRQGIGDLLRRTAQRVPHKPAIICGSVSWTYAEMRDVATGEIGEIVHRSPQLLSGYYNDPAKTAAAFAGGWFHSGDLATVDDEGYITVVDRVKDMIKTGGENVASREVEETIYRLPGVSEVAGVGLLDPRWIEAVTAIVVVKAGATLNEAAVIDHCAGLMAHFKVPKRVVFVDELPKNPSGKLLKRELRHRYLQSETLNDAVQRGAAG